MPVESGMPLSRNDPASASSASGQSARSDLNFIRTQSGGLDPVPAFATKADALTELLKQKRYSLLFEGGHRWIDARRYHPTPPFGLPIDQPATPQYVIPNFPIPTAECDARGGACSPAP